MINVHCCAATRLHRRVCGDGRLFAADDALHAEGRHEVPQTHRRAPEVHARFRINTTTLMRTEGTNERTLNEIKENTVTNYLVTRPDETKKKEYTDRVKGVLNDIYNVIEEIIDIVPSTLPRSICEEVIEEQNMIKAVDEKTAHQIKDINGKMLSTTAEGGKNLDNENDERHLFLNKPRYIRSTGAAGVAIDVTIEINNRTAATFHNLYLSQERNGTTPMEYFYDSTELKSKVHAPLATRIRKKKELDQVR